MSKDMLERGIALKGARALALHLGCHLDHVYKMRRGDRGIDPEYAYKLAALLGEDPLAAIIPALEDSAKTPEQKAFWADITGKWKARLLPISAASAVAGLAFNISALAPFGNERLEFPTLSVDAFGKEAPSVYYVKLLLLVLAMPIEAMRYAHRALRSLVPTALRLEPL